VRYTLGARYLSKNTVCLYNLEDISFSKFLGNVVKREIGLHFVVRSLSAFL
jgi:hypothetical protein